MNWTIPLIVAFIAAIVATRNAGRSPHDRLKAVVDIHKDIPDGVDTKGVLEAVMARELEVMAKRYATREKGIIPYLLLLWHEPLGVTQWLSIRVFLGSIVLVIVGAIVAGVWALIAR